MSNILVIKHGALGDVVLATAPFAAIRRHHLHDHITLLTTPAFAELLRGSGYFDEIWIDNRAKFLNITAFLGLIRKIAHGKFSRVYDLQTSERTAWYFRLLPRPRPEWVGTAAGASHLHDTPHRTSTHTVERHKEQLAVAGIHDLPAPNVDWLVSDVTRLGLPERYALIVAGGSSHRHGKRWSASNYAALCSWFISKGITPVLLGTQAEESVIATIESLCPQAMNLSGQTSFSDVATLARGAICAVGNDTGPMHLIAVAGCPCLVLFSQFSNPLLCSPRGNKVRVLQEPNLAKLHHKKVESELGKFLGI